MSPAKAAARSNDAPERIIRDPEFARRLDSACDASGLCPPLHKGRLTWVQHELKRHFKEEVSVETVRKWFAGEAKPRQDKVAKLAKLLQVDVSWLSLGVEDGIFRVPAKRNGLVVLGIQKKGFTVEVYGLADSLIEKHGSYRGGMVEAKVQPSRLSRVESFAQRL